MLFNKKDLFKNSPDFFYHSKTRNANLADGFVMDEKEKQIDYEIILPQTFMNNSGDVFNRVFEKSSKKELKKTIKEIEKIIVIYDDIALPFGEVKISYARGDGGHNGIKDITKKLGTKNYIRVRIGVCPLDFFGRCRKPKGASVAKYLTSKKFSRKQIKILPKIEKRVEEILEYILKHGYKKAMNKFN